MKNPSNPDSIKKIEEYLLSNREIMMIVELNVKISVLNSVPTAKF